MIIPSLKKSYVGQVYSLEDDMYENIENLDCRLHLKVDSCYLSYKSEHDEDNPCKPYLRFIATCDYVEGDFPHNITKIKFNESQERPISLFYEFSDEELGVLVFKGLYHSDFEVPRIIEKSEFSVDGKVDVLCVNPDDKFKVPLMFANVSKNRILDIDKDDLEGISLVDLFEVSKSYQLENDLENEIKDSKDKEEVKSYGKSKDINPKDNIFESDYAKEFMEEYEKEDIKDVEDENVRNDFDLSDEYMEKEEEVSDEDKEVEALVDDAYDMLSDEEKEILALQEEYELSDEDLEKFKAIRDKIDGMIERDYKFNNRNKKEIIEDRKNAKRQEVKQNEEMLKEDKEENSEKKPQKFASNILDEFDDSQFDEDREF